MMIEGAVNNIIFISLYYAILFIIVPAICLHYLVRGKRLIWRLAFYQICGFTNLAFWGYLFAFLHIWPVWILRILLIYLPILLKVLLDRKRLFSPMISNIKEMADGTIGKNMLVKRLGAWIRQKLRRAFEMYLRYNGVQLLILLLLSAFLVWYYGYFKLHYTTYAASDEATHLYWIHALMTDQAFPVGLYPHLLHFVVASISSLVGISAMYVNHFLSIVGIVLISFTLYCVMKSIFRSKAACIWGIGVFVIANLFVIGDRYQMTLPMEFGFIPMLMVVIFLHDYKDNKDRWNWWMIILSLFCAVQVHFTPAIFALFFVIAYLIVFARKLFRLRTFAALGLALVLSLVPFGVGLVSGYQMEQSMGWAVSLLENRDDYYEGNALAETAVGDAAPETASTAAEEPVEKELTDTQKEWEHVHDVTSFGKYVVHLMTGDVIVSSMVAALVYILELFAFCYGIWRMIYGKKHGQTDGLLVIPVIWLIVFITHAVPKAFGLSLTESGRMQILLSLVSVPLFAVPVQALSNVGRRFPGTRKWMENVLLGLSVLGLGACWLFGDVKDPDVLRYNFVIQSESFRLTDDIINNNVKDTWTVISPVNDLVGIRCYGYHYEIIDLLWEIEAGEKEFYIPTPDIYVIVEKQIPHFAEDATSIALRTDRNGEDLTKELSDEPDPVYRNMSFDEIGLTAENKAQLAYYTYRQPTMTKLYYWMEKVKQTYPGEVSIYSEDDNCIVYHIAQDPYFLLNLALDYRTN